MTRGNAPNQVESISTSHASLGERADRAIVAKVVAERRSRAHQVFRKPRTEEQSVPGRNIPLEERIANDEMNRAGGFRDQPFGHYPKSSRPEAEAVAALFDVLLRTMEARGCMDKMETDKEGARLLKASNHDKFHSSNLKHFFGWLEQTHEQQHCTVRKFLLCKFSLHKNREVLKPGPGSTERLSRSNARWEEWGFELTDEDLPMLVNDVIRRYVQVRAELRPT